ATSEQVEIMVSSILKAKSSLTDLFSFRSHVRATRSSDLTSEQPEIVVSSIVNAETSLTNLFLFRSRVRATRNSDQTFHVDRSGR
ncbi:unnamed protein product, partial [Rotaria magnacalcarata]